MEIIKPGMLETELARREVMRNMKAIKETIKMFSDEARESKIYTRQMAAEAFKIIDKEVEKQTAGWLWPDEHNRRWDEV